MRVIGEERRDLQRYEPAPLSVTPPAVDRIDPPIQRRPVIPAPPVRETIGEATEQELLATVGPSLVAYRSFDPLLRPVVLVHGMDGNPAQLTKLADAYRSAGRQVYVFCYDDRNTPAHETGEALARALSGLRASHPAANELEIVAHSFGGVITRAALNTLANPSWHGHDTTLSANPRAGFESMRVRTLDTPWQGYNTWIPPIPILSPILLAIVHFFFWLFGFNAAWEMRSDSDTLRRLHETRLDGVDLQNIAAHQAADARDHERSLDDLSRDDLAAATRFVTHGEEPRSARVRNWCHMLANDSRYAALRAAVRSGRTLTDTAAEIMPSVAGTHMSLIEDDALIASLVRSTPRRSPPQSPSR